MTEKTCTHLISDERYGGDHLIADVEQFVRDMEASMLSPVVVAQKLAEAEASALDAGGACEATAESIREQWRRDLRAALKPVRRALLISAAGGVAYVDPDGACCEDVGGGVARYLGDWSAVRAVPLSEVAEYALGEAIVHNDRGNGCAGPGSETANEVELEVAFGERDDVELTQVLEDEDAEAWELSREAFRLLGLDPSTVRAVLVGERDAGDNGHQTIYSI